MRSRLRSALTADELASTYPVPHDHTKWVDHVIRVDMTVAMARAIGGRPRVAADLSCGDAAVVRGLEPAGEILGDYAPGWPIHGPIEQTITGLPDVDLWVCCETVEHLDDPDKVLRLGRDKAAHLLLSTPVGAHDDRNPEHYWSWDRADVEDMLAAAGWVPQVYAEIDLRPAGGEYAFGVWWCR